MNNFIVTYWYNLGEVVQKAISSASIPEPYKDIKEENKTLFNILNGYNITQLNKDSSSLKDNLEKLFVLVYARYNDEYCFGQEEEETINEDNVKKFFVKLVNILSMTYDKYNALLSLYEAKKGDLLAKVKNTSAVRFNDTPQNGGSFEDDSYTTSITETESGSDFGTPIERLKEVDNKFQNVLKDWSKELDILFIEEGNLDL